MTIHSNYNVLINIAYNKKRVWVPIGCFLKQKTYRRYYLLGVVAQNGLLYVIGGDDGSSNLGSVEYYSPRSDTWTMLQHCMTTGRSYAGVCVIDKPM